MIVEELKGLDLVWWFWWKSLIETYTDPCIGNALIYLMGGSFNSFFFSSLFLRMRRNVIHQSSTPTQREAGLKDLIFVINIFLLFRDITFYRPCGHSSFSATMKMLQWLSLKNNKEDLLFRGISISVRSFMPLTH